MSTGPLDTGFSQDAERDRNPGAETGHKQLDQPTPIPRFVSENKEPLLKESAGEDGLKRKVQQQKVKSQFREQSGKKTWWILEW